MSDSSIIQQARDVLAKWRDDSTPGPWTAERRKYTNNGYYIIGNCPPPQLVADVSDVLRSGADVPLIVGTAGNPDLLDALDEMLNVAHEWKHGAPNKNVMFVKQAECIAAAIIAADERMTS